MDVCAAREMDRFPRTLTSHGMGAHGAPSAACFAWVLFYAVQAETDPSRRLAEADWARGLCSRTSVGFYAGTARSFAKLLPSKVLEKCKTQTPSKGSWIWKGRNWCWEAVKRHACYGHHSWEDAQSQAAADKEAPDLDDTPFPALQDAERCDLPELGASLVPDPPPEGPVLTDDREERDQDEQTYMNYQIEAHEAEFWFHQHVAVYVLNLPTAADRWSRISRRLEELHISADRVPGIDLSEPGAIQQAQEEGLVPRLWNFSAAKQNMVRLLKDSSETTARRYLDNYGRGTIGCAAAHLRAMWQATSNAHRLEKPVVLILEDDVTLEDDFMLKLRRLLRHEAPCDWEVISLRSQCPYGVCVSPHLTRVQPDANEPEEMCRHGVNYGFYAMLYRDAGFRNLGVVALQLLTRASSRGTDFAIWEISVEAMARHAAPWLEPGPKLRLTGVSVPGFGWPLRTSQLHAAFLGEVDCLHHPRELPCLTRPLADSFHGGVPVSIKVRNGSGAALLEFKKGAFAQSDEELQRGLEGRRHLGPEEALLLRYQQPRPGPVPVGDVMRNTPQDLEIGWFDGDGKLLEVAPLRANDAQVTWSKHDSVAWGLEAPPGTFAASGARPGEAMLDVSAIQTNQACSCRISEYSSDQRDQTPWPTPRVDSLISIANKLHQRIWDETRPGCLANDVALASLAEEVVYYAVPSSQVPGFVGHGDGFGSVRGELNRKGESPWLDLVLQNKHDQSDTEKSRREMLLSGWLSGLSLPLPPMVVPPGPGLPATFVAAIGVFRETLRRVPPWLLFSGADQFVKPVTNNFAFPSVTLPSRVTVEQDTVGGVPGEWHIPEDANSHVDNLLVWAHGGGFMFCSPGTHRLFLSRVAERSQCAIFCPNYRKPPKHPFPEPLSDVWKSYEVLRSRNTQQDVYVGGDSAGGNLALEVARRACAEQVSTHLQKVAGVLLLSPWVDLADNTSDSWFQYEEVDFLPRQQARAVAKIYASTWPLEDPAISPVRHETWPSNFPPVHLEYGGSEVFRDQIERLVDALRENRVELSMHLEEGQIHCYPLLDFLAPQERNPESFVKASIF
ncbi:mlhB [Symbiodinium microadriaticum]|nr:mlhB [Symbiodinium microadriaticum]